MWRYLPGCLRLLPLLEQPELRKLLTFQPLLLAQPSAWAAGAYGGSSPGILSARLTSTGAVRLPAPPQDLMICAPRTANTGALLGPHTFSAFHQDINVLFKLCHRGLCARNHLDVRLPSFKACFATLALRHLPRISIVRGGSQRARHPCRLVASHLALPSHSSGLCVFFLAQEQEADLSAKARASGRRSFRLGSIEAVKVLSVHSHHLARIPGSRGWKAE